MQLRMALSAVGFGAGQKNGSAMRNRFGSLFAICILIALMTPPFCKASTVHAAGTEQDNITNAIKQKRARWIANDTSVSRLTPEARRKLLMQERTEATGFEKVMTPAAVALPGKLDWRNYNGNSYVTPVREQGSCGACWAFATAGALESNMLISQNVPNAQFQVSAQALLSCSGAGSCNGGWVDVAADFVRDVGLPEEGCYPYTANEGNCAGNCTDWPEYSYYINDWYKVPSTVDAIKYALYNYGPLVTILSVQSDFLYYKSGVYSHTWGGFEGYHAALIVGYNDAGQYFIVKSSWGDDWGEAGYSRIAYSEINSETKFGSWVIAYENTIPRDFPVIDGIPRDPSASSNQGSDQTGQTPASVLSGMVKDETGKAVGGAAISIDKYAVTSDSAGQYRLSSIPAGNYVVTVMKDGYASVSESISVASGTELTRDFVISASSTDGKNEQDQLKDDKKTINGPGFYRGRTDAISLDKAHLYYAERKKKLVAEGNAPLASLSSDITPEIQELARALHYDPNTILDYVRNQVHYLPYYGALKGATLTYLDGSGNDWDQASLLLALLRESKTYNSSIGTVQYAFYGVRYKEADLERIFGVDRGLPLQAALANGGIPFSYREGSGEMDIQRMWVRATIDGTTYDFDPAFKFYAETDAIDIKQATGYDPAAFIASATSGATVGADSVKNVNEANIISNMTAYSTNLVNAIRQNHPNKDAKEIFGGREIIREQIPSTPSLPYGFAVPGPYDAVSDEIPNAYVPTIKIQYAGINYTIKTSDLSGKRLTITHIQSGSTCYPQLNLDGSVVASGNTVAANTRNTLKISVDHVYASPYDASGNPLGTYQDQTGEYSVLSGGTYAIAYSFGDMKTSMHLQKQQQRLDTYQRQGLATSSEKVLGETLNIIGTTYFREFYLANRMISGFKKTSFVNHHSIGLVVKSDSYYVDMQNVSYSTNAKKELDGEANIKNQIETVGLFYSSFEHGILEQLMGLNGAVSTVKLLKIANAGGNKIYHVNSGNYSTILNQVYNYSSADITKLRTDVQNGYKLILPENGQISLNNWTGNGYIEERYVSDNKGTFSHSLAYMIGGGLHGGYSSYEPSYTESYIAPYISSWTTAQTYSNLVADADPNQFSLAASNVFMSSSADPVDMASGALLYDRTDIGVGAAAPLGLSFSRSYDSRLSNTKGTLGYGWTHNNDISLKTISDGMSVLSGRQPVDAASLLAALYVVSDVMKTDAVQNWVAASLATKWAVDQLIENAVSVKLGKKQVQFIKLADGTYSSPPGIKTKLIKEGSAFTLQERFGTTMKFNADNKISEVKDIDGNAMTYAYNADKTLASVKDAFNRTLTISYSGERVSAVSDSAGRSVSYAYDANSNLTGYTDPEGKLWSYGYDANHMMTTLKNPLNITTATNVYDGVGRVKTQTTPRQGGTYATYDFYFSGYRNSEKDPAGQFTTYYYDEKGREYAIQDSFNNVAWKIFDGQDHVIQAIDPLNNTTSFTYDGNHNLTQTTNALGYSTMNTYDGQFRLTDTTDPLGHKAYFTYDAKHHLLETKDALNNTTGATYYGNGSKNTATDARSAITTLTYDGYGNPRTAKTNSHPAVTYTYDSIGRMTALTDQEGATTSFTYDKRGLLTSKTDPLGRATTFNYDDAGRMTSRTDRKGHTISYAYTPSDKMERITYPDNSTVNFTYNQLDNLVSMQDATGTSQYAYDSENRLVSMTNQYGMTINYTYDSGGRLAEMVYPGNRKVIYTYDELNRLTGTRIDWLNLDAAYTYDEAGRLTGMNNFNGTGSTFNYDNANRLTAMENRDSGSGIISTYNFSLDGNGNRTQSNQSEPYQASFTAENVTYTYNTQKNRLLSAGANTFNYDNEGQLNSGYGSNYTFDYEHRLTGMGTSQFTYDGKGNRIQAARNGVTTRYIYDAAGNLLAEADSNNNITRYYIHGKGLLAMVTPQGETYCYHYNATGSTIALTDMNQNIINAYAYDPFGNVTNQVEPVTQPFKFVGQFGVMTEPNGFYYMRARYYDPKAGRFISEDPTGFSGGDVNLMAYVANNPIMGIDPSGLRQAGLESLENVNNVAQAFCLAASMSPVPLVNTAGMVGVTVTGFIGVGIDTLEAVNGTKGWDHPAINFIVSYLSPKVGNLVNNIQGGTQNTKNNINTLAQGVGANITNVLQNYAKPLGEYEQWY